MHAFLVALGWRGPESGLQLPILRGYLVPFKPGGTLSSVPQIPTHIWCIPVEGLLLLK